MTEFAMIEDYILVKNLMDGNIYSLMDISILTGIELSIVKKIAQQNFANKKIIGDGSGIIYCMDIKYDTIVDGPGFRNTIYCSKCTNYCKNCHNPSSWELRNGKPMTVNQLFDILKDSKSEVTFSGGEFTLQAKGFTKLAKKLKEIDKNIWAYSGYIFEDLVGSPEVKTLLNYIDVLVDGCYIDTLQDASLLFRGSRNQRIIDVQKSLEQGKVVLWEH